jgi:hypothetical protein
VQVHAGGLRHIRADRRVNEWRAPGRRTITRAATNERQAVIVLSGGDLLYFELDAAGQLQVRLATAGMQDAGQSRAVTRLQATPKPASTSCPVLTTPSATCMSFNHVMHRLEARRYGTRLGLWAIECSFVTTPSL